MREEIKYQRVRTVEHLDKLTLFAKSFDHDIVDASQPVTEFKKDDTTLGYGQIFNIPVGFFAFHPETCSPRDALRIIQEWRTAYRVHDHKVWAAVSFGSKFTPEIMEKLGFFRMGSELYSI